jgi:hypothetical protein
MLTAIQFSQQISVANSTLARWRLEGKGPRFLRAGRRILYDPKDIFAWLEANKRQSTSEIVGGRAIG